MKFRPGDLITPKVNYIGPNTPSYSFVLLITETSYKKYESVILLDREDQHIGYRLSLMVPYTNADYKLYEF
jgi:hypothetical protein